MNASLLVSRIGKAGLRKQARLYLHFWLHAMLVLHALVCLVPRARAEQAHTFALNWARGPGAEACISSRALAYGVEQVVGPVFRPPAEASRAIEGIVTHDARAQLFRVSIRLADARGGYVGERSLESKEPSCESLTASILLVIALVIDPEASERGLPPELLQQLSNEGDTGALLLAELEREAAVRTERDVVNEPAPPAKVDAAPPTPVAKPPKAKSTGLRAESTLAGSMSYGLQPKLNPGLTLTLRLITPGPVSIEFGASYWTRSAAPLDRPTEVAKGVDFRALHSALSGCVEVLKLAQLRARTCAGAVLGYRWAKASSLSEQYDAGRPYLGPLLALAGDYTVRARWYVWAASTVAAMFPRDRFVYTDRDGNSRSLFRPSRFVGWSSLGLGLRF